MSQSAQGGQEALQVALDLRVGGVGLLGGLGAEGKVQLVHLQREDQQITPLLQQKTDRAPANGAASPD